MDVLSQECAHSAAAWISVQRFDTRANDSKFPLEYSSAEKKVLRAENLPNLPIFHDTHQAFHRANVFIALQVLHFPLLHANEWLLQKISPACSNLLLSTKQPDDTDCGWAARRSRRQKAQQLSAGIVPRKDAGRHKPLLSRLRQTLWRAEIVSAISCFSHYALEHRYCSSELTTGHILQELSRLSHLYQNLPPPPTPNFSSHPSSFLSVHAPFHPQLTHSSTSFHI